MHCPLCRSTSVSQFPIGLHRALRSDGIILDEPLNKDSCADCGALIGRNSDYETRYYRSDGTSPRELERHIGIARGLKSEFTSLRISGPILEVGAANFQTAIYLARSMPNVQVTALEPSPESLPQTSEIEVQLCGLENFSVIKPFAAIYANHVLEHISNPKTFLCRSPTCWRRAAMFFCLAQAAWCQAMNYFFRTICFISRLLRSRLSQMGQDFGCKTASPLLGNRSADFSA